MIPQRLYLHNFMSYKNPPPLDFSVFEIACISGENGSGKSSLLEAITWALWGKARGNPDALIHQREQGMWVDFEFTESSGKYRVIRKRSKKGRGTSELDFLKFNKKLRAWETVAGASIKETEEVIQNIIKLPYEIFVNSAYLRQGHADEFTKRRPTERKEILGKILDLEFYEQARQKVREKIILKEAEIESLERITQEIAEELKQEGTFEKELKETEKILRQKEGILKLNEKKLEKLSKDKSRIDVLRNRLSDTNEKLFEIQKDGQNLKNDLVSCQRQINEIKMLLKRKNQIEAGYKKLKKALAENEKFNQKLSSLYKIQEEIGALKAKEEEIKSRISRIKKIKECPTCLRVLTKKDADEIIKGLENEYKNKVLKKKETVKKQIEKIGYNEKIHSKIKSDIKSLEHFEEEKNYLSIASTKIEERKTQAINIQKELVLKRKKFKQEFDNKKSIESEIKKLEPVLKKWEEQNSQTEKLRADVMETRETYGALKQRLSDLKTKKILFKEKKNRISEINKTIGVDRILVEVFSKNGIQTEIIQTVIPEIEQEANKILEKITAGRMRVEFITSRERKSGEGEVDTLDILIEDQFGKRDYSLYSGGEAFRIDLAIRVALSKVLSKRAGTKLQFLAIDEGFGSLDSAGKDEVAEAINGLRGDFEKILIVTHLQELKNLFPARVEVVKTEEGSQFELINI